MSVDIYRYAVHYLVCHIFHFNFMTVLLYNIDFRFVYGH